jgi:hypothetical protein
MGDTEVIVSSAVISSRELLLLSRSGFSIANLTR